MINEKDQNFLSDMEERAEEIHRSNDEKRRSFDARIAEQNAAIDAAYAEMQRAEDEGDLDAYEAAEAKLEKAKDRKKIITRMASHVIRESAPADEDRKNMQRAASMMDSVNEAHAERFGELLRALQEECEKYDSEWYEIAHASDAWYRLAMNASGDHANHPRLFRPTLELLQARQILTLIR